MSTKKQLAQIAARNYTREEAEAAMRDLCIASCKIDAKTAKMNESLARIRAEFDADISSLSETAELLRSKIQSWADKNPGEFARKKSVDMVHGTCGYRFTPPAVRTLRGVTWEKAVALVESIRPDFIRVKKEADKEALLAAREVFTEQDYTQLGLRIDSAEKFFVDVKKDSVEVV